MQLAIRAIAHTGVLILFAACGNKSPDSAVGTSTHSKRSHVEIVCSYAPSQSAVVSHVASAAGGSGIAATAIAKAAGLSAVAHSSGAYIFTGSGGYLAGTLGTAVVGPVVVGVGFAVGGVAASIELLCAPRNHPEMVARIEAASRDFLERAQVTASTTSTSAAPYAVAVRNTIVRFGDDVWEYASRKSIDVSAAINKAMD
jgi:hypothetical protein